MAIICEVSPKTSLHLTRYWEELTILSSVVSLLAQFLPRSLVMCTFRIGCVEWIMNGWVHVTQFVDLPTGRRMLLKLLVFVSKARNARWPKVDNGEEIVQHCRRSCCEFV